MSIAANDVTVTTTATVLASADQYPLLVSAMVPPGGATVAMGGSDVAVGSGQPGVDVPTGGSLDDVELKPGSKLYGRVAAGTQVVEVFIESKAG